MCTLRYDPLPPHRAAVAAGLAAGEDGAALGVDGDHLAASERAIPPVGHFDLMAARGQFGAHGLAHAGLDENVRAMRHLEARRVEPPLRITMESRQVRHHLQVALRLHEATHHAEGDNLEET